MNTLFEDRLSAELQAAAARLTAGQRARSREWIRVAAPVLAVAALVGVVLIVLTGRSTPAEQPSSIHRVAPVVDDGQFPAGAAATPRQQAELRNYVGVPVTHVVAAAAPKGEPHLRAKAPRDWLVGRTKRRICVASGTGAACSNPRGFLKHGVTFSGPDQPLALGFGPSAVTNPAPTAGQLPISRVSGILPPDFSRVQIIDPADALLAKQRVINHVFSISVPDLKGAATAFAVRRNGTVVQLAKLGTPSPVPSVQLNPSATPAAPDPTP